MTEQLTAGEEAELVNAARAGDSEATARLLSLYLPYWTSAARRIIDKDNRSFAAAGAREEPAELVQEAIVKHLQLWRDGKGPLTNTRSYVATMMQNAYLNKLRSPRTRELPLDEEKIELALITSDDVRAAELSQEIGAMKRAFDALSPNYREVLVAVTIEGKKPAELTERFGRSAPAISSMLQRAKQSLFRLMLIDYLSAGDPECVENAAKLPLTVHVDPAEHDREERGLAHVHACAQCQRNWHRFGAMPAAFGVLPFLTIPHLAANPTSAAAAEPDLGAAQGGSGQAAASGSTRSVAAKAPMAARITTAVGSKITLGIGIALVAGAGLAAVGNSQFGSWQTEETSYQTQATVPGIDFDLTLTKDKEGALRWITVDFSVLDTDDWSMDYLDLDLSDGTDLVTASNGLQCEVNAGKVHCLPTYETQLGEPFQFQVFDPVPGGEFSAELEGSIDKARWEASASGRW